MVSGSKSIHRFVVKSAALFCSTHIVKCWFHETNLSTYFPFQLELMMQVSSICLAAKVPVRVKSLQTNPATINDPTSIAAPKWSQKTITLPPLKRGCHLVTSKVCQFFNLFLHHHAFLPPFSVDPMYMFLFQQKNLSIMWSFQVRASRGVLWSKDQRFILSYKLPS